MAQQYAYQYAVIDPDLGDMCIGYNDTTSVADDPDNILVPVWTDDYLFKYYKRTNGKWYEDAEFTIEWIPPEA